MTSTPNWWKPLMRAAEAHGLNERAAVARAEILHDDDCARLRGTGVCDCDPDVRLLSRPLDRTAQDPGGRP